jgi:hypothetical protein
MKPCPSCGGLMEKIVAGTIVEPIPDLLRTGHRIIRRGRLATYYACTACEHCEEQ